MTMLSGHPTSSVRDFSGCMVRFLKHVASQFGGISLIQVEHLVSYRSLASKTRLIQSSKVHRAIRYWARLGIPGISAEALAYAVEAKKFSHELGKAVRLRCPVHGPYTSLEWEGLYKALLTSFAAKQVDLADYALCILSGALGPRPSQLADLKVGDYKAEADSDGTTRHLLAVPRVKLRSQRSRSQFTSRELVGDIGLIVTAQVMAVRELAAKCGIDAADAPLFPAPTRENQGGLIHISSAMVSRRIADTIEGLAVRSERTGEVINATPTRARRTLGTRAAQEGHPVAVIAELLDHSQTRTAQVYVETRMEMLDRLDEKLAFYLAPMAQRFAGKVVRRGHDREDGVERHVLAVVRDGEAPDDVGGCGKHAFCGLPKPMACYTCILFQAWLDGPHEAVLEGLLAKRARQAQTGSLRVAEALDDTILAVAWVVQQCRAAAQGGEAAALA